MFCSNCGKEIADNSKFCQFCGAKIQDNSEIIKQKTVVDTKKCSVCGFEYPVSKRICPNCTADNLSQDKIDDIQNCGQYEKAKNKNDCMYKKYCIHKACQYTQKQTYNQSQFTNESQGCAVIIAIIVVIFMVKGIFSAKIWENKNTNYSQQSYQQETQNNNDEEIKKIENYIKEFQKSGIFVNVTNKGQDDLGKMIEIQVDEYSWNNLPYDAKKATENMFLQYYKIANVTILFRGYKTGEILYTVSKNFKI
jgi:hypothetical protein